MCKQHKECAGHEKRKEHVNHDGRIYPALIVFAGVVWGLISLFSRSLGDYGLSSLEISGVRCLVAAPVLALVLGVIEVRKSKIAHRQTTCSARPQSHVQDVYSARSQSQNEHLFCNDANAENQTHPEALDTTLPDAHPDARHSAPNENLKKSARKNLFHIRAHDIWMFAGAGILSFLMFGFLYFQCMQLSEVSVAVILLYTSPAWLILLGRILFKEKIDARKLGALALTIAGCVLVSGVVGSAVVLSPLALLCGLGSGFTYALYSVFGTLAMRKYNSLTFTFYAFLFAALAALVVCNPAHILSVLLAQPYALASCAGIGIVCTVLPFLLYTAGLAHVQASRAGILATSEPVVSCIVGVCVFGENLNVLKGVGIVLVLASLFLANGETKSESDCLENTRN